MNNVIANNALNDTFFSSRSHLFKNKCMPSANSVYSYLIFHFIFASKTTIMVYWTLDYFKSLYDQYVLSGVSIRKFCKEHETDSDTLLSDSDTRKPNLDTNSDTPQRLS